MPVRIVGPAGAALLLCFVLARPAAFVIALSGLALALVYAALDREGRRELGPAPAHAAWLLPAAAWLLPDIALLFAATALVVPLLARRRGDIAPLYLFTLLLLPGLDIDLAIGGLKLSHFGVHDGLACGAGLALLVRRGGRARVPLRYDLPFLCVMGIFALAYPRETSLTHGLRVLVDLWLDCALPYYIVSRGVRSLDELRRCLLFLAAAGAVVAAILAFEAARAWPIYNILYDHYANPMRLIVKSRGGLLRAGGPFLEPTSAAMVLVFCFLAAWVARPAFRSRGAHRAVLALLLVGLAVPQSRGAWIGLFVAMAVVDLYRGRWRPIAMRAGLVGAAALALVVAAQGNPALSESVGLSGGSAETVDYREQLFSRGLEELRDSPLIGFAYPELLVRLADLRQGEGIVDFVNTHLFVALISGVIGLVVFNAAFLVYLTLLWRWRRRVGPGDRPALGFAFAALITPLQMLAFTSFGGRIQVLVFVFFGFAAAVTTALARAAQPSRGVSSAAAATPASTPAAPAAIGTSSSPASNSPIRWSARQA